MGSFFIVIALAKLSGNFSDNMKKGMASLLCAFKSGFINFALLLDALYYTLRQFNFEHLLVDNINKYYPYLCTCQEDVAKLEQFFSIDEDTAKIFETCVETDYDECAVIVDNGDSTYSCTCDYYFAADDNSSCLSCEVPLDDGAGNLSCNQDAACMGMFILDVDVCYYDCDSQESGFCVCEDYTDNGAGGCTSGV